MAPTPQEAIVTLSGPSWVELYPTSRSTGTLAEPFQTKAERFITALEAAGIAVKLNATYRPPERAYLMRYAWDIAHGKVRPQEVPAMPGVLVQWNHGNEAASVAAARAMVAAYGLAYRPSLTSLHIERRAIDMTITGWAGKSVRDGQGALKVLKTAEDLYALGASYGVKKLRSDPPHWSDSGH